MEYTADEIRKNNIWMGSESNMSTSYIDIKDKRVMAYTWTAENPKCILKIQHGMAEYAGRYDDFARYLNGFGVTVVALDERAHGYTDRETLGYGEGNIWENTLVDQMFFSRKLKADYPNLPLILLGHSYGSFLTQRLMQTDKLGDGFILTGSSYMKGIEPTMGKLVSRTCMLLKGDKAPCKPMFAMSFSRYHKKFKGNGSWISRDKSISAKYKQDELSGFCCSNAFYYYFMDGIAKAYTKKNLAKVPLNKPIFIASGQNDAVSNMGRGAVKLFDMYRALGVKDLTFKLYPEARHEVLNELNRLEVYTDIKNFIVERFM
ncbi:MAG: alpha/beta hydrolase [Clostridia bacterium]|nr:alpha/beta hydrolase [Clostridia bacterium]